MSCAETHPLATDTTGFFLPRSPQPLRKKHLQMRSVSLPAAFASLDPTYFRSFRPRSAYNCHIFCVVPYTFPRPPKTV